MINRHNYETWFLMYVDNELNASEKLLVENFLAAYPEFQSSFDLLQQIKFLPDEKINYEEKDILYSDQVEVALYKFQPDESVVYPLKEELYKNNITKNIRWGIPVSIAATVLVLIALFSVMFDKDEDVHIKTYSEKINSSLPVQKAMDISKVVERKQLNTHKNNSSQGNTKSDPVQLEDQSIATVEKILQTEPVQSSAEEVTSFAETIQQSNISDEARKAAKERSVTVSNSSEETISINTAMLIESVQKNEQPSKFRGLIRKIGRRIFKDIEEEQQVNYIRFSNFALPVSNKK